MLPSASVPVVGGILILSLFMGLEVPSVHVTCLEFGCWVCLVWSSKSLQIGAPALAVDDVNDVDQDVVSGWYQA